MLYLGVSFFSFAAVLGYLAARELVGPMLATLPGDEGAVASTVGLLFANMGMVATTFLGIFLLLSPPQTALDNLLATKPVTPGERTTGLLLPLIAVTLTMVALCFSPIFAALLFGGAFPPAATSWFVLLVAGHVLYVTLAGLILYLLLAGVMLGAFGAGYVLSQVVAASAVILVSFADFVLELRAPPGDPDGAPLTHPFDLYVFLLRSTLFAESGPRAAPFVLATGVVVAGHLLLWLALLRASRLVVPAGRPQRSPWLEKLPVGSRGFTLFLFQELKQAARHPENLGFAALFVLISGLAVAFLRVTGAQPDRYAAQLPVLIWLLCSLFSHNSYGRTLPSHWLFRVVPRRRYVWLTAKLASNCLLTAALAAALFLTFAPVSDQFGVASYLQTAVLGLLLTVAVTLAGTVLPYSAEYPFSAAASALLVAVAGIPLGYALQALTRAVPVGFTAMLHLGLALALAALVYLVDDWRYRSDVDAL